MSDQIPFSEPQLSPDQDLLVRRKVNIPFTKTLPADKPLDGTQRIYYDLTNYWLYIYSNGAWRSQKLGVTGGGSPGGSDTQVQFNDGGNFGGDADLTWDKTNNILSLGSGGGAVVKIVATDSSNSDNGDELDITGSAGGGTAGNGGDIRITAGKANAGNGNGGALILKGGLKNGSGNPGDVIVSSNISTTANGGFLVIPYCSGAPTGTPSSNGAMVYDSSGLKLYIWVGSWKSVLLS